MKKNTETNRQAIRERLFFLYAVARELKQKFHWSQDDWVQAKLLNTQIRVNEALLGARG